MRSIWWLVALVGIQLGVLFSYIHFNSATVQLTYAMQREERAVVHLQRQREDALQELEMARSLPHYYTYAKELGMQPIRLKNVVYLPSFDQQAHPARPSTSAP